MLLGSFTPQKYESFLVQRRKCWVPITVHGVNIFLVIAKQSAMIISKKALNILSVQLLGHLPSKSGVVLLCKLHDHLCGCAELQCLLWVEPARNAIEPPRIERSTPRVDFD